MPTTGLPFVGLVLPIALTAIGLAIAAMIRSIEFERIGVFLVAVLGVTVGQWAMSFLSFFVLSSAVLGLGSGWSFYAVVYGAALIINTAALGLTSLVMDGFKVRGFVGLLVAGTVVTLVENSLALVYLPAIFKS
jgi:heme/copper-type cytochrome/quinol oxidase subunit 4